MQMARGSASFLPLGRCVGDWGGPENWSLLLGCVDPISLIASPNRFSQASSIGGGGGRGGAQILSAACIHSQLITLLFYLHNIDIILTFCLFLSPPCADFHSYPIGACIMVISLLLPLRILGYIDMWKLFLQLLYFRNPCISASHASLQLLCC